MNDKKLTEAAEMERRKGDAPARLQPGQGQSETRRHTYNTTQPAHLQGNHAFPSQPAAIQRKRILAWLRRYGTMTTLEARNELSIMHPGGRVMELRRQGHSIVTIRLETRVAKYVLLGEAAHDDE